MEILSKSSKLILKVIRNMNASFMKYKADKFNQNKEASVLCNWIEQIEKEASIGKYSVKIKIDLDNQNLKDELVELGYKVKLLDYRSLRFPGLLYFEVSWL